MSIIYISCKAPVKNIHQPLSDDLLKRNKRLAIIFLSVDGSIMNIYLFLQPSSPLVHFSILSIALVALLIIPVERKGGFTE